MNTAATLLLACVALFHQAEEQQKREAEAAAIAAAEAAALAVQLEYEASLPDDVKAKVTATLEREVVSGRWCCSARYTPFCAACRHCLVTAIKPSPAHSLLSKNEVCRHTTLCCRAP